MMLLVDFDNHLDFRVTGAINAAQCDGDEAPGIARVSSSKLKTPPVVWTCRKARNQRCELAELSQTSNDPRSSREPPVGSTNINPKIVVVRIDYENAETCSHGAPAV